MALYTQEQLEQANSINLEEYLLRRGEKLKRTGKESRFYYRDSGGEHDSVSIRGNRWYDHKNQTGGYPVKFLQEFYGLGFREAVRELLDEDAPVNMQEQAGTSCAEKQREALYNEKREAAPFALPEKAGNMKRLFAYLLKTRLLSQNVVKVFADAGLLYQESRYNNIVFVGTDAEGNPKSASLKSSASGTKGFRQTISGSDPRYGFCWRGGGERLLVFESAVDLMSFLTLYPKDWVGQNYIALDGLSPKAMLHFLQEQGNISETYLCLDNDPAGIEACDKFKDLLLGHGYAEGQVWRLEPHYKDWNENLKAEGGLDAQPAQPHPKKDAYQKNARLLKNLNRNTDATYCQWRDRQAEKVGQAFYLRRIAKEWEGLQKAKKPDIWDSGRRLEAGVARIADLSVCMMCGLDVSCTYNGILTGLEQDYKPYKDKLKLTARLREMKEGIDAAQDAQDRQSLFCCLKFVADMALRLTVYLQTDYAIEIERRNRFQTQEKPPPETLSEESSTPKLDSEEPSMAW